MGSFLSILPALIPVIIDIIEKFKRVPPPNGPTIQTENMTKDEREEIKKKARTRLGLNPDVFNFAVTGQRGTGKSSLVNGIRLLPDDHPNAAKVGEVEMTAVAQRYPHPALPHFVVWDLPGAGTPAHPIASYFDDKCLMAFDALVLVCENAFTEGDFYIAREATNAGIPVIAVRSKPNNALQARLRRDRDIPEAEVKAALIAEVKNYISTNLASKGLHLPVFVVNAWWFTDAEHQPSFEENIFMNELHRIAEYRVR